MEKPINLSYNFKLPYQTNFVSAYNNLNTSYKINSIVVNFWQNLIKPKISKTDADIWWESHNSWKDIERDEFIHWLMESNIKSLWESDSIIDIWSAWAPPLKYIWENQKYLWVDMDLSFFEWLKKTYPDKKFEIVIGALPDKIDIKEKFNLVICSMVLHWVDELEESIKSILDKKLKWWKLLLVAYSNESQQIHLNNDFIDETYQRRENFFQWKVLHPWSKSSVYMEIRYHKEEDIEKILTENNIKFTKKYSNWNQFVSYECSDINQK